MASITVKIPTVPTRSDSDTVASYNVYSNQPSANTLIGTMTPAEAASGKAMTFSDGVVHSVTAKAVWTTAGESSVASVPVNIDTTGAGTVYGIATNETKGSYANSATINFTGDWTISFTLTNIASIATNRNIIGFGNVSTVANGYWSILRESAGTFCARIWDSVGDKRTAAATLVNGDTISCEKVGNVFTFKHNGTTKGSVTAVGWTEGNKVFTIGAATSSGTTPITLTVSNLSIKGETWSFSEQTGSVATGSGSTVITLNPGTGTTSEMWVTIP